MCGVKPWFSFGISRPSWRTRSARNSFRPGTSAFATSGCVSPVGSPENMPSPPTTPCSGFAFAAALATARRIAFRLPSIACASPPRNTSVRWISPAGSSAKSRLASSLCVVLDG